MQEEQERQYTSLSVRLPVDKIREFTDRNQDITNEILHTPDGTYSFTEQAKTLYYADGLKVKCADCGSMFETTRPDIHKFCANCEGKPENKFRGKQ